MAALTQAETSTRLRGLKFKKNGTKMLTKNGNFFVNFHNFFLFMKPNGIYVPWILTLKHGSLPNIKEWTRLQGIIKVTFPLTDEEELIVQKHVAHLKNDPLYQLSQKEREEIMRNKIQYAGAICTAKISEFAGAEKLQRCKRKVV